MAEYYCHKCALELHLLSPAVPDNLTATQYQLDKFIKHTAPTDPYDIISIFSDPAKETYRNYIINTSGSGCLQIDDRGRRNLIWVAGKEVGATFENGIFTIPNDSIKVVLHNNEFKIHSYPTLSDPIETKRCKRCNQLVIY